MNIQSEKGASADRQTRAFFLRLARRATRQMRLNHCPGLVGELKQARLSHTSSAKPNQEVRPAIVSSLYKFPGLRPRVTVWGPLVGRHRRGREPELFAGPAETLRSLDNYIGSMAIDLAGEIVATSSPRGGQVVFWDAATGRCIGQQQLADGCGVAPFRPGKILATSGRGTIEVLGRSTSAGSALKADQKIGWDNHLRRI